MMSGHVGAVVDPSAEELYDPLPQRVFASPDRRVRPGLVALDGLASELELPPSALDISLLVAHGLDRGHHIAPTDAVPGQHQPVQRAARLMETWVGVDAGVNAGTDVKQDDYPSPRASEISLPVGGR